MDLKGLSDFILVTMHDGFSAASRISGEPKATLSRRVRALEEELGVRLLDRASRGLRLTDEGAALYARARGPLSEIAEAEIALQAGADIPQGRLRVSAPVLFSEVALGAIAASYAMAHPAVRLEIVAEDREASAIEESIDVLIRTNPRPNDELIGRCFFRSDLEVVVAPALAEAARIRSGAVPSIVLVGRKLLPWRVSEGATVREIDHDPIMRVSSALMAYHAALAGAGATVLPGFMVAEDVAAGRLVKLGTLVDAAIAIWALYPVRRTNSLKVTSFLDHLTDTFADAVWPGGRMPHISAG